MFENISRKDYYRVSGIYVIHNDKYYYIGQSVNIYKRISMHKNELLKGIHGNSLIQRVYDKHQDLVCDIVELCAKEQLNDTEKKYIDCYSTSKSCMNLLVDIQSPNYKPVSDEARAKMSATHKKNREKNLPIYLSNLEKARAAPKVSQIGTMKGKKHKESSKVLMSEAKKGKSSPNKGKSMPKASIPIYCIDEDGVRTDYESAKLAAQILQIDYKTLHQRIKYSRTGRDGTTWFYNNIKVIETVN